MSIKSPPMQLRMLYHRAAQEYLRSLPLEHFMESTPHATQREITLESLALVRADRPDFHVFNELLVQYPLPNRKRPGQVVPDNMVVIHDGPIEADGSYDVPLESARPFWMLEYVSKNNRRKDYADNMQKYEHELKVPFYLLFDPKKQHMTLYRHNGKRYVAVKPDAEGRCAVEGVDISAGLHNGWVRFWYKGKLLPLPAEMDRELKETQRELAELKRELARLRARGKNGKN